MNKEPRNDDAQPAREHNDATKKNAPQVRARDVTPQQRWNMIAEAAYYRAEKRDFVGGDPAQDWLAAEAEIDERLGLEPRPKRLVLRTTHLSRALAELDSSKVMGLLKRSLRVLELPGVDIPTVLSSHQRNVEALTSANRAAMEGLQGILARQMEILQQTMQEANANISELTGAANPGEAAVRQGELAKEAFENALRMMLELAEMAIQANTAAFDAIQTRVTQNIGEVEEIAARLKPK